MTRPAALPSALLCLLLAGCSPPAPSPPSPTPMDPDPELVGLVRAAALPLAGAPDDYDPLMELARGARVVLLGEASHGTAEFYAERARITRRLIAEAGFDAVAVEGDWPAADRVNRFVRGRGADRSARGALGDFSGFPVWTWRNREVLEFVEWLRDHNASSPAGEGAGFYGLDVYSLYPSIDAVTGYLDRVDPTTAPAARERYACFARYGRDPQAYGQAVEYGAGASCRIQAMEQVRALEGREAHLVAGGDAAREEYSSALQNARLVRGAEEYFRSLFLPGASGWNLRDRYMFETLEGLLGQLSSPGDPARVVVWAHNTHVGNAAATHMGELGELSLGQLVRERYGEEAVLVGFTTYSGTVTAADEWGAAPERKRVLPALPESYEAAFHRTGIPRFLLVFRGDVLEERLRQPRLERAIGVIYLPRSERQSHYFHARLPDQFDAVIHLDETRAVAPLEWTGGTPSARQDALPGRGPGGNRLH